MRGGFLVAVAAALVIPVGRPAGRVPASCEDAEGRARCLFIERNIGLSEGHLTLERIRKLGRLAKEDTRSGGLAPGGGTITIRSLTFEGLAVEVAVTPAGPVLLRQVALSRPGARLGEQLLPRVVVIGRSTIDDVEYALGLPKSTNHTGGVDRAVYPNLEETAQVEFEFEPDGGPLRRVTWSYQVD